MNFDSWNAEENYQNEEEMYLSELMKAQSQQQDKVKQQLQQIIKFKKQQNIKLPLKQRSLVYIDIATQQKLDEEKRIEKLRLTRKFIKSQDEQEELLKKSQEELSIKNDQIILQQFTQDQFQQIEQEFLKFREIQNSQNSDQINKSQNRLQQQQDQNYKRPISQNKILQQQSKKIYDPIIVETNELKINFEIPKPQKSPRCQSGNLPNIYKIKKPRIQSMKLEKSKEKKKQNIDEQQYKFKKFKIQYDNNQKYLKNYLNRYLNFFQKNPQQQNESYIVKKNQQIKFNKLNISEILEKNNKQDLKGILQTQVIEKQSDYKPQEMNDIKTYYISKNDLEDLVDFIKQSQKLNEKLIKKEQLPTLENAQR